MEAEKKAEEERKAAEATSRPGATIDVAVGTAGAFAATFDAAKAATEPEAEPEPSQQTQWSWEQNVQQETPVDEGNANAENTDNPQDPFTGGRFSG